MNLFASWNITEDGPRDNVRKNEFGNEDVAGQAGAHSTSLRLQLRVVAPESTYADDIANRSVPLPAPVPASVPSQTLPLPLPSASQPVVKSQTARSLADSVGRFSARANATLANPALATSNLASSAIEAARPMADASYRYSRQVSSSLIVAAQKWVTDEASAMAAGVAYYLALSLFPMVLLLTSGLGLVFRFTRMGHDAELQILSVVAEHCSPTLEQQVRQVLAQLREHSLVGGPFGLLTATLAAIGVFYRFERSFDKIWRVKPPADKNWWAACVRIIKQRISAFLLLASLGMAITLIMLVNVAVGFVQNWMSSLNIPGMSAIGVVDACITLLMNAVVFGLLYRFLPKRPISMIDAFRGGLLAALVWELGRQLLGAVLIGVRYTAAYGAIGSFIAMLLWCYWGVSIIFFGAEYAQVLSDRRRESQSSSEETPVESERDMPSRQHRAAA